MALKQMLPSDVKLFIVHCSATKETMDIGAKEIGQWHKQKGYLKIGYHFVIRRDGTVEKGRSLNEPGAHAQGVNSKSIGICMVGGLDKDGKPEDNFTDEQYESLALVIRQLKVAFPHVTQVIGHRDVHGVKKDCPCFDVKQWWSQQ